MKEIIIVGIVCVLGWFGSIVVEQFNFESALTNADSVTATQRYWQQPRETVIDEEHYTVQIGE